MAADKVRGILFAFPVALWIIPIIAAMFTALVWLALLRKDEVSALFLHGKTKFRIDARGRRKKQ